MYCNVNCFIPYIVYANNNIFCENNSLYMKLPYRLSRGYGGVACTTLLASIIITIMIIEKGNVLFFQLQFGTYLPTFRLDALAILTLRMARASSRNVGR